MASVLSLARMFWVFSVEMQVLYSESQMMDEVIGCEHPSSCIHCAILAIHSMIEMVSVEFRSGSFQMSHMITLSSPRKCAVTFLTNASSSACAVSWSALLKYLCGNENTGATVIP